MNKKIEHSKTFEQSKCLASLAVFRELYDNKNDIYGVISDFIVEIIITNSLRSFGLTEITSLLNKEYYFNLPEAVVKTSLKRLKFLIKDSGSYSLNHEIPFQSRIDEDKKESIQKNNKNIINDLIRFTELDMDKKLDDNEKENIVSQFVSFIMDGTHSGEYSKYISAFTISKRNDENFKKQISTIKEGVVLYYGIRYNDNIYALGSWKSKLTIFVGTEILFHLAGYNGEIYQKLWEDLFKYIKEINDKNSKTILLRYFEEVETEIKFFFNKAEDIVARRNKLSPRNTAMAIIVKGCRSESDVIEKKIMFFSNLKKYNIIRDDFNDYFDKKNHQYNIGNKIANENFLKKLDIKDPYKYVNFLNYVSIRRQKRNRNNFEDIGYILLSGNAKTLQVAWDRNIKELDNVPLATDLHFLTNKFWFKLNKGFGKGNVPLVFDMITKAQIVLSSQMNKSVGDKYDELQAKLKKGEISEEHIQAIIVELRKETKKPEDINEQEISFILRSISENDIEKYIKQHEHLKISLKEKSSENLALKEKQTAIESNLIVAKRNLLVAKTEKLDTLQHNKKNIDKKIEQRVTLLKTLICLLVVAYVVIIYFFKVPDWIVGTVPGLLLLYAIIREKTFNPVALWKQRKNKIKEGAYKKFDRCSLELLEGEISKLKIEIESSENNSDEST